MSSKRRVGVAHFLLQTYEMLETPKLKHLIEWSSCGEFFYIKNYREFANKILPQYFRHKNFQSFLRQLNMYNFVKKRLKNGWNSFQHKYFKRDAKHLLCKVHRRSNGVPSDDDETQNSPQNVQHHLEQIQNIKSMNNTIFLTYQQLLIQTQMLAEQFSLHKNKLLYQFLEEQKQDQFIHYVFNSICEPIIDSPKQTQTVLACNPMTYTQDPNLFVLS